ncbi:hypothetical protein D3C71_1412880 [compost metagenome]
MGEVPDRRRDNSMEGLVPCSGCPWRDTRSLDAPVERAVVGQEVFEVRDVPRTSEIIESHHEAMYAATNSTARLNVFGGRLGLSVDQHQTETRHIDAYGYHVRREDRVTRRGLKRIAAVRERISKLGKGVREVAGRYSAA